MKTTMPINISITNHALHSVSSEVDALLQQLDILEWLFVSSPGLFKFLLNNGSELLVLDNPFGD